MEIRYAKPSDLEMIAEYDDDVSEEVLKDAIAMKRIILLFIDGEYEGWLRFNLFWDNIPFMNLLYLSEDQRGKGYGTKMVEFWEREMAEQGFGFVLTSTQSDEEAQFFYRKLGYTDRGALVLPDEPLEIIFYKNVSENNE
ncbi:MAG: GNAT family N-acetyltransferase [Erysipelotrichaceae bacterium]|jgi:GNAT superfamily N-acetyltransferase|nr:GNAT family N-acetyltransferase [Erysipelotrichaceae bacterium]MBR0353712.1 GNAT family N-acetyltransferase [Oscillospiraceae bacterium]MBR0461677.1 GNAT family N-acetyltransferase [Erysipelotrichaceae bacterium]